jgi:hypothetical protein
MKLLKHKLCTYLIKGCVTNIATNNYMMKCRPKVAKNAQKLLFGVFATTGHDLS